jgi:outer membrane biosynthesis protein TonB
MGSTEMIGYRKLSLALVVGLVITVTPASAATKSPTPTPKASVSKKAVEKKAVEKKAPVKKPAEKKKAPAKKKPPAKKKAPAKKKESKLSPSPSPKWPPAGFRTDPLGETNLYMKIPTAKELVGILSAKSGLASQIKACTKFTCGAVLVASELGCRWWQVTADVVGATSPEDRTLKTFGKITTSVTKSNPQKVITILLVTTEPIGTGHVLSNISVDCNQSEPTGPLPNTEYQPVELD